jgi:hypothetical protein
MTCRINKFVFAMDLNILYTSLSWNINGFVWIVACTTMLLVDGEIFYFTLALCSDDVTQSHLMQGPKIGWLWVMANWKLLSSRRSWPIACAIVFRLRPLRKLSQCHSAWTETRLMQSVIKVVDKLWTPWPLVRKRTIPTERPPLVDEI